MRKHTGICLLICGILAWWGGHGMPAHAATDNAVQMVTYFPVPYAAYNALFVSDKFDVGTYKGPFTLNLGDMEGCGSDATGVVSSLQAPTIVLKSVPGNTSSLSFNTDIYTSTATFGVADTSVPNTLNFRNNLRVGTISSDDTYALALFKATETILANSKVKLFPGKVDASELPVCEDTVSWKLLELGNDTSKHYFLACADEATWQDEKDIDCTTSPENEQACPGKAWCYKQTRTYDCDRTTGTYIYGAWTGECPSEAKCFNTNLDTSNIQNWKLEDYIRFVIEDLRPLAQATCADNSLACWQEALNHVCSNNGNGTCLNAMNKSVIGADGYKYYWTIHEGSLVLRVNDYAARPFFAMLYVYPSNGNLVLVGNINHDASRVITECNRFHSNGIVSNGAWRICGQLTL